MERPYLGFGLGLRKEHYQEILEQRPAVDWFEILSENYLVAGGKPLHWLERVREHYPLVMHGVSLSIGSSDPLDMDYLRDLKGLVERVWLVWRQALDPRRRPLAVDEAWALQQAREGADFATLCEGLLEWLDLQNAPLRAASFLRTWLQHGLITRFDPQKNPL